MLGYSMKRYMKNANLSKKNCIIYNCIINGWSSSTKHILDERKLAILRLHTYLAQRSIFWFWHNFESLFWNTFKCLLLELLCRWAYHFNTLCMMSLNTRLSLCLHAYFVKCHFTIYKPNAKSVDHGHMKVR